MVRRLMKFLHTIGAIGMMGAMADLLGLLSVPPPPTSLPEYALMRGAAKLVLDTVDQMRDAIASRIWSTVSSTSFAAPRIRAYSGSDVGGGGTLSRPSRSAIAPIIPMAPIVWRNFIRRRTMPARMPPIGRRA